MGVYMRCVSYDIGAYLTGRGAYACTGTAIRDYIHPSDLATGHLSAVRHTPPIKGYTIPYTILYLISPFIGWAGAGWHLPVYRYTHRARMACLAGRAVFVRKISHMCTGWF
jgi:hypothetical protein